MLLLKARQEKAKPVYKVGCKEIAEAAQAMHKAFVRLNQESNAVLAEMRACGWMRFRPDSKGLLQLASKEQWARKFTEGSSRMGPEFRANRDSWVRKGKVLMQSKEEEEAAKSGPDKKEQEGDYFNVAEKGRGSSGH